MMNLCNTIRKKRRIRKEEWRAAISAEFVRMAVLASFGKEPCRSEDEAAVLAFWRLYDPMKTGSRTKTEITYTVPEDPRETFSGLPPIPPRIRWLTAHVHPDEPLRPSPDDLLLYDRLDLERGACSHFILDGLRINKIR